MAVFTYCSYFCKLHKIRGWLDCLSARAGLSSFASCVLLGQVSLGLNLPQTWPTNVCMLLTPFLPAVVVVAAVQPAILARSVPAPGTVRQSFAAMESASNCQPAPMVCWTAQKVPLTVDRCATISAGLARHARQMKTVSATFATPAAYVQMHRHVTTRSRMGQRQMLIGKRPHVLAKPNLWHSSVAEESDNQSYATRMPEGPAPVLHGHSTNRGHRDRYNHRQLIQACIIGSSVAA